MTDHILNEGYNRKNNLFIKGSGSKIYNKSKLKLKDRRYI